MSDPKHGERSAGIKTKAELEQRRAARPRPRAELHLTPPGITALDVKRRVDEYQEARIKLLETRLKSARTKLRHDLSYAVHKGKARGDFDRSR